MRGREGKGGAPPTDLLVCFPSRTHLALMPKPICSPARPMDSTKRHNRIDKQHHHHHLGRSSNRIGRAANSPVLWAKTKSMECDMSEPTSQKSVVLVRSKSGPKQIHARTGNQ
ncbi:hypothetical protein IFM89_039336 [Coptis chinensis]|uniref:Uncharacterized protein n=1 Tax=Coptis chinensis TaxID=261450 RepID=A0A835LT71_9MAGN|nr:hypothetical protein IFM89_039336 [Coptis chinensis]